MKPDMPDKPPEKLFSGLSDSQLDDIARDAHYNVGPTLQHVDALIASHRALRANHAAEKEKVWKMAREFAIRMHQFNGSCSPVREFEDCAGQYCRDARTRLETSRTADIKITESGDEG